MSSERMQEFETRMNKVFDELFWSDANEDHPDYEEMKERAKMMLELAQLYYDDTQHWHEPDICDEVDETNYNPYMGQDEYECVWFEDI